MLAAWHVAILTAWVGPSCKVRDTLSDDADEPKTEEEWLAKLLAQQQELARLRAAIEAAKGEADGEAEIEEDLEVEEVEEVEEEATDKELQEMLAKLNGKRNELNALLEAKAELQARIDGAHQEPEVVAAPAPPPSRELSENELQAVLMHRKQAQEAVEEQERKIAQLTALQADLRSRLSELAGEDEGEEEEGDEEEEDDDEADGLQDDEKEDESGTENGLAERVLMLLASKTDECQQLAAVVEEARAAGMDPQNPRLQVAEHNLATRYQEIKELAAFAHRLGLTMDDDDDDAEVDEGDESEEPGALVAYDNAGSAAALEKVQRLESELAQCVQELRVVDANASDVVARHPAFRKMRATVVDKLEALHAELTEARAAHQNESAPAPAQQLAALEESEEEIDLSPMLKAALDKLWQRPYDCRIFTLQLLQSLAQLDDQSLCMMTSCFARYLENHSVPA